MGDDVHATADDRAMKRPCVVGTECRRLLRRALARDGVTCAGVASPDAWLVERCAANCGNDVAKAQDTGNDLPELFDRSVRHS